MGAGRDIPFLGHGPCAMMMPAFYDAGCEIRVFDWVGLVASGGSLVSPSLLVGSDFRVALGLGLDKVIFGCLQYLEYFPWSGFLILLAVLVGLLFLLAGVFKIVVMSLMYIDSLEFDFWWLRGYAPFKGFTMKSCCLDKLLDKKKGLELYLEILEQPSALLWTTEGLIFLVIFQRLKLTLMKSSPLRRVTARGRPWRPIDGVGGRSSSAMRWQGKREVVSGLSGSGRRKNGAKLQFGVVGSGPEGPVDFVQAAQNQTVPMVAVIQPEPNQVLRSLSRWVPTMHAMHSHVKNHVSHPNEPQSLKSLPFEVAAFNLRMQVPSESCLPPCFNETGTLINVLVMLGKLPLKCVPFYLVGGSIVFAAIDAVRPVWLWGDPHLREATQAETHRTTPIKTCTVPTLHWPDPRTTYTRQDHRTPNPIGPQNNIHETRPSDPIDPSIGPIGPWLLKSSFGGPSDPIGPMLLKTIFGTIGPHRSEASNPSELLLPQVKNCPIVDPANVESDASGVRSEWLLWVSSESSRSEVASSRSEVGVASWWEVGSRLF
uniref:Uncharacterized protein n=1 Tax=Cannabis sativa TaxID=3483 RepID=A0A803PVV7_CANSA